MKPSLETVLAVAMLFFALRGSAETRYVWTNSPANGPGTDWTNAFHDIQSAVDAATNDDVVLVTNGVYETGGRVVDGAMTNRVAIDRPITVQSVNGPELTIIQGQGPLGGGAVRCVYVANGAVLVGFTLTNGYAQDYGGGIYCEADALVSNSVIRGNSAYLCGGGAYQGTLYNCTLVTNRAELGGGGAYEATLCNCLVVSNSAGFSGGGADGGAMYNCLVIGNVSDGVDGGGGACQATLHNCTLSDNTASFLGGGVHEGILENCIVHFNEAPEGWDHTNAALRYCCADPRADGEGNINADPQFWDIAAGDYRLQSNSPCVNGGLNEAWMVSARDLAGQPRIQQGSTDMGAYESSYPSADTNANGVPDTWEFRYFGDLNTVTAISDWDGDGFLDVFEYWAGTDPKDGSSLLTLVTPNTPGGPDGLVVSWQSTSNRFYRLERTTNLLTGFDWWVKTNIPGMPPVNTETDTTAVGDGPWFYRVDLE